MNPCNFNVGFTEKIDIYLYISQGYFRDITVGTIAPGGVVSADVALGDVVSNQ